MISYKGKTFCQGGGCANFHRCPLALTPIIIEEANKWWGKPNAPISQFSDPSILSCFATTQKDSGKSFLCE